MATTWRVVQLVLVLVAGASTVGPAAGYANDGEFGGPHRMINELALNQLIKDAAPKDPILRWYCFDPVKLGYQLDVSGRTVVKSG